MPSLRKANAYSKRKAVPYTRISKKKSKSYIKAVPQQKIVKFTMGDEPGFEKGKFPYHLILVSKEKAQIRHNSLEACRQYVNKELDKELNGQFVFKVLVFPHHVQRENKMLAGAGADRMQTGMQKSFGKAMGKSAFVKSGSRIFFIAVVSQKGIRFARRLFSQIKSKLPCKTRMVEERKN